jgi:hypothetical protein
MKTMKKIFYITVFSLIATANIHALLVTGDPQALTGDTFSFNVGFACFDAGSENSAPRLWTANNDAAMSSKADTVKPYGLSLINQYASCVAPGVVPTATPMANQEDAIIASFNGTSAVVTTAANPIWGGQFAFFSVPEQLPLFTLATNLQTIYLAQDIKRYETPTAEKPNVTSLIQYDFTSGEQIAALTGYSKSIVFAAHASGAFGSTVSKITELMTATNSGITYLKSVVDTVISGLTYALIGGSSGHPLTTLGASVTLNYTLQHLYIGLECTANGTSGACATALTYATLNSDQTNFDFQEIAPGSILFGSGNIATVVSAPASGSVRIKNIAGMATSTGLQYLIVARDTGTGPQTIYALPVTNAGKIADFRTVQNNFKTQPALMTGREFTEVVSNVADIDPAGIYSEQLLVGAATPPLSSGSSIKQLYAVGDSVYVVIGNAYATGQTPGTFYSQAIFGQDGHIVAWSPWQRVLGSDDQMNYSFVDRKTISGYYISGDGTTFKAVNQTTFVNNSNLSPILLALPSAGIQGLFNFPQTTPGFNNALSLLASTGYQQLVLGQTGIVSGGFFQVNSPVTTQTFAGTSINSQGALVACEMAHNGANHWLFVGGDTGLSVLTGDNTGYSWTGNLANVAALNAGQTFKTVGNFKFIKKLVWDASSTYLYVVTSTGLYRIALDPNKFKATPTTDLNAELLLSSTTLTKQTTYFLDFIIDGGFCIIATTGGLYTFTTGDSGVQQITIPNGLTAASQLLVIAPAPEPQRNFAGLSNIILLNNSFGTQQARINRFVVSNGSVVPFDDFLIAETINSTTGVPSSFIRFNNYINNYFSDGSWNLASSYYLGANQPPKSLYTPSVLQLFANIRTGFSSSQMILPFFSDYAPLSFLIGVNLAGFIRESTSGALVIYGSFETQANV